MASDQIRWTDPDGFTLTLTDWENGYALAPGRTGFAAPPMELATDTVPGVAGAFLRDVIVAPRTLSLPLTVTAPTQQVLRHRLRDLGARMNPTRGDSTLTSVSLDGTARRLAVRYVDGLQGAMGRDVRGPLHQRLVIVCQALQPYWEDVDPTALTWAVDPAPTWFPLLPLSLGSSTVLDDVTITNSGDQSAYPTWTINGPGRPFSFTNGTDTLLTRAPHFALTAGDTMVIDTSAKTVTVNGVSAFDELDPVSVFWALEPGDNSVSVEFSGTTEDSSVSLSYRRRWLSS